jgi:O-succinylhomoserine sulfhydrylase
MPGGGQMIAFEIKGGKPAAFRFLNALNMIIISNNLGDTKSIVTHPATTTHSKITQAQRDELGISDGMIRLSIGLEAAEDIADDLTQALNVAHG